MVRIERSQPAPTCLEQEKRKKNGDYRCGETEERLIADFFNKCYLCEQKAPTSINVEHFKPQSRFESLRCEWTNLFFACAHCNHTKHDKPEFDDVLDCTQDPVETAIRYDFKPFPKERPAFYPLQNDSRTQATAKLLDACYNGITKHKQIEAGNLRSALLQEIRTFQTHLLEYYDDDNTADERAFAKQQVIKGLRRSTAFAAFKRWIIRSNSDLLGEFESYLD